MNDKKAAEKETAPVSVFPLYTVIFGITLGMAAVLTLLRTLLLMQSFDAKTGLQADSALSVCVWIGIGVSAAALLLSALVMKKKNKVPIRMPGTGILGSFCSLLCGVALMAVPVLTLLHKLDLFRGLSASGSRGQILIWFFYILLVPAAFSFFAGAAEQDEKSMPRQILAIFPVLFCGLMLMVLYFDRSTFMNDSLRVLTQLSMIALMAALLYELRVLIGKPTSCGYFILTDFAIIAAAVSSLPKLILALSRGWAFRIDIACAVFEGIVMLYLIVREGSVLKKRLTLGEEPEEKEKTTEPSEK